ncbi:MAG TPA: toxic cation resistance protein [Streptomyces sp.]|nr:toxic cation resistance protein [Streptomyces sp.]
MGIRSLLRNVFGRSRAGGDEPVAPTADADTASAGSAAGSVPEHPRNEGEPAPAASAEAPVPAQSRPSTTKPAKAASAARTTPAPESAPSAAIAADLMAAFDAPRAMPRKTSSAAETADTPEPVAETTAKPEPKAKPGLAAEANEAAEEAKATAAELAGDNAPEPEGKAAEAPKAGKAARPAKAAAPTKAPKAPEPAEAAETPKAPEAAAGTGSSTGTGAESTTGTTTGTAGRVSLEAVESTAPGLVSLYKAASVTLDKRGLAGQRAAVYLVLDRSGSMRNYYKDGTVQHLAEQALGLSANLDDDGTVPVVFFSTGIDGTADISLDDYEGRIETLHAGLGHMGRTHYDSAIEAVVEHYKKSGSTDPAFVIFQTDGAPTSKPAAEKALCEAAELPIFWQFIGFGETEAKGFDFLRKLDNLAVPERRKADNAGFFHAGPQPMSLTDAVLYDELTAEFPEWLAEAREKGILG